MASIKVLWRNHIVEGETWESKANLNSRYPHLFPNECYVFLLVKKIMTKFEVAFDFC